MATVNCPECGKGILQTKNGEYETVYSDRNGVAQALFVPGLTWLECDACGEAVLADSAMSVVEDTRRKALGILSAAEIRAFRAQLRKSQRSMSELLGIGEKTYCRWESGSYMQSEASDRYLRLLMADSGNIQLLQEISTTKGSAHSADEQNELKTRFRYVSDVHGVEDRGRVFVDLMTRGALYATN